MLSIIVFSCIDASPKSIALQELFQAILLEKVFVDANRKTFQELSRGAPLETICFWVNVRRWFTVRCDGFLDQLHITNSDGDRNPWIGHLNIGFLPHTITDLNLSRCLQKQRINTRYFPKEARKINFQRNKFYGDPDLSKLPLKLEHLALDRNNLKGPINLCFLPESLKTLSLSSNDIKQDIVLYDNLPENIRIYLGQNYIGGLYSVSDAPMPQTSEFYGVQKHRIH